MILQWSLPDDAPVTIEVFVILMTLRLSVVVNGKSWDWPGESVTKVVTVRRQDRWFWHRGTRSTEGVNVIEFTEVTIRYGGSFIVNESVLSEQ